MSLDAVKVGAGLLTHWQALAFGALALVAGLSSGALYFYDKGYTSASVSYERAIAEGNAKVKSDHDAQQAQIADLTKRNSDLLDIAKRLDRVGAQLPGLIAQAKQPPVVFKSDCVLPPDQMAAYNAIH